MSSKQKSKIITFDVPIIIEATDQEFTSKVAKEAGVRDSNSLDVGCGNCKRGSIGVDRFRFSREVGAQKSLTKTLVDVIAVGEYLPFIDSCFEKVFSYHSIEHSDCPERFLRELIRVCSNLVELRCPHRFSSKAKMPFHRQFLSKGWFNRALGKMKNISWNVDVVSYWSPLFYFLFHLPDELKTVIWKRPAKP